MNIINLLIINSNTNSKILSVHRQPTVYHMGGGHASHESYSITLWVDDHLVAANNISILDCRRSDLGWTNHGLRVYWLLQSTIWSFILTTFNRNPLLSHLRIWMTHHILSKPIQNIFNLTLWYIFFQSMEQNWHCKLLFLIISRMLM